MSRFMVRAAKLDIRAVYKAHDVKQHDERDQPPRAFRENSIRLSHVKVPGPGRAFRHAACVLATATPLAVARIAQQMTILA